MLGTGFGLAALSALQVRRMTAAVALLLLCSASSPLALLFVLVPLTAAGLSSARWWREPRLVIGAVGIGGVAVAQLLMQLAFGRAGARYPSGVPETVEIGLVCAAGSRSAGGSPGIASCGGRSRPTPLWGRSSSRSPRRSAATPRAWRSTWRRRCCWCRWPRGGSVRTPRSFPSSRSRSPGRARTWCTKGAPMRRPRPLPTRPSGLPRPRSSHATGTPGTASKWSPPRASGVLRLPAHGIPLARGWFRQDDWPQNAALYGPLSRRSYLAWLRDIGVRYVLLPDAHRDTSARAEALLVHRGGVSAGRPAAALEGLRGAARDADRDAGAGRPHRRARSAVGHDPDPAGRDLPPAPHLHPVLDGDRTGMRRAPAPWGRSCGRGTRPGRPPLRGVGDGIIDSLIGGDRCPATASAG